jgi:hypothetical protein
MAKVQKFYAHYNVDTKRIYGIANHKSIETGVEITRDEFLDFISGVTDFHNYTVSKKSLVLYNEVIATPSNGIFFVINEKPKKKTELTVDWNLKDACWIFSILDEYKVSAIDEMSAQALFFVVSKENFNLLFKTIIINIADLVAGKVTVPFSTEVEYTLSKIELVTRFTFKSYGLNIYD